MINDQRDECRTTWQQGFVAILPEIEQRLRHAFRHLDPESRDDSTEDGIVHILLSYVRLYERGREQSAAPASLVHYAALAVRKGRQAACRMNSKEPLARYAQFVSGFRVERLQTYSPSKEKWIDLIVEDRRASVADQVAARMDFGAWFATLSRSMRRIARDLALGFSTSEVARKHGVSAGRISQLRRKLEGSWAAFQEETAPEMA